MDKISANSEKILNRFYRAVGFVKKYEDLNTQVDLYTGLCNYYYNKSQLFGISEEQKLVYDEIMIQINRLIDKAREKIIVTESDEIEDRIKSDDADEKFDEKKLNKVYEKSDENDTLYDEVTENTDSIKDALISITYGNAVEMGFFEEETKLSDKNKKEIDTLKLLPDLSLRLVFANALRERYDKLKDLQDEYDPKIDVYAESSEIISERINDLEQRIFAIEENYIQRGLRGRK